MQFNEVGFFPVPMSRTDMAPAWCFNRVYKNRASLFKVNDLDIRVIYQCANACKESPWSDVGAAYNILI